MLEENKEKYEFQGSGLTTIERKWAKKQFESYRERYHIDSFSDLQILEELTFREALQERTKKKIEELSKLKNENNVQIPQHHIEFLDENLDKILALKEKLGLFEDKGADPYQYIQILKKKFRKWLSENQGSRSLICPHCGLMIMLKIKTESWEAMKHPLFKDRILANEHLWKLYKEGKISKEDVALVLGTAENYIDWLEEKIYNPSSQKLSD